MPSPPPYFDMPPPPPYKPSDGGQGWTNLWCLYIILALIINGIMCGDSCFAERHMEWFLGIIFAGIPLCVFVDVQWKKYQERGSGPRQANAPTEHQNHD